MKITDTVGLLLKSKGQNKILSIEPDQSVYEAIEMMATYNIGALLVLSDRRLVGILSERDIVKGLQVGQLNHDKDGLFKGVFSGGGFL